MPCHPARARELLRKGRAVPVRSVPFVIRLKDRVGGDVQPVRVCLDPGSKTTGIAVAREVATRVVVGDTDPLRETVGPERHVLWLAELTHRGGAIRDALTQRSKYRRGRRSRNLRYRPARYSNRRVEKGWLPPSLRHRIETTMSWVGRLRRWMPVVAVSVERVKFDTQAMVNPDIEGVEYQQGTLCGYEVREYLLEKWGRQCAYCDAKRVPLQVEHVRPRGRGGALRVGNLTIACGPCNQRKGARRVEDFLARDPKRLTKILSTLTRPLEDAAAVTATRWPIDAALRATGLSVESSSGGRTKFNRTRFGLPKTHALDAACVGVVGGVFRAGVPPLGIACMGRGTYQRTIVDKQGFPRRGKSGGVQVKIREVCGFRTGDLVRSTLPKTTGMVMGRIVVRANKCFDLTMTDGSKRSVVMARLHRFQRADGYRYGAVKASA